MGKMEAAVVKRVTTVSFFAVDRDSTRICTDSDNYLDIFCQNFLGIWNKAVENFNNVCYFALKVMSN
jgi:hypothetical protein